MTRDGGKYGHFCMLARTLERVGDRWTLLVVRDLSGGPRRFTDLIDRLGGITPKTLTQRLRELEAGGLIAADRVPGRREVWYRLTPAGEDLRPALDELLVWGLRHAVAPPEPGEPAHPEHLLWALQVQLERESVALGPVRWLVQVVDDGTYALTNAENEWQLEEANTDAQADVVVTATRASLARFLTTPPPERDPAQPDLDISGSRAAIRAFLKAIAVFPMRL
jgi:DNA-binding HxlR family transcriptional regulator